MRSKHPTMVLMMTAVLALPLASEATVKVACVKDENEVAANMNKDVTIDREVVIINNDRYQYQNEFDKGDRGKAVKWYRQRLDELKSNSLFEDSEELQNQAGELERDLEQMEQNPDGEGRRNAGKASKMKAIGYMQ